MKLTNQIIIKLTLMTKKNSNIGIDCFFYRLLFVKNLIPNIIGLKITKSASKKYDISKADLKYKRYNLIIL